LVHRSLQGIIAVVFVVGVALESVAVLVNAALALGATLLPAVLRRDYDIRLSTGLTLWITSAVTLHTVGMIALYEQVWWWDHLTHVVSAALVASVGYAVTTTLDEHSAAIHIPEPFLAVYILLFTIAAGVVWELAEMVGRELSRTYSLEAILVVYGLEDTMLDLVFDMVGAVVVAVVGGEKLRDLVQLPRAWQRREQ
jgi:FlaA1/EpsC-like NDP-sugar epimerase